MRLNPIWTLLSLFPSLVLSAVMIDDLRQSQAFSRPFVGNEPLHAPSNPPTRATLSKEMEERVRTTLESGLVKIDENETAYIENASQKAQALCFSLYDPTAAVDKPEEVSLQVVLSSRFMAKAQTTLATMESESTAFTEELSLLSSKSASFGKSLASIEKDLGVLSRAIQSEKEKAIAGDPKKPANLAAAKHLKTKMEALGKQKEQLEKERRSLDARRCFLEEQKERKELEIFVHRELIKLREKRDSLSQAIRQEELQLHADPVKLASLNKEKDTLDQDGWEAILAGTTLKMLEQEGIHLGKNIAAEHKNPSLDSDALKQLVERRKTLGKAIEKFAAIREKKRRVQRVLALIKDKLTPAEIQFLILGEKAVVTSGSFFRERIAILERLAALPPKIRQALLQQAQRFIEVKMSANDRLNIAKAFVDFGKTEDGENFSRDLTLHKTGPITPRFIKSAANAWREGRQKFLDSLRRVRSMPFKPSNEFANYVLELPEDTREKFLGLFSKSPSAEEIDVLYYLTEIDRRHDSHDFEDPIEKMAKLKRLDPKRYEDELERILFYYNQNPETCINRALEEKKEREKQTLRKVIVDKLIEETLRNAIREDVERELDIKNMRQARLRKIAESKSSDSRELTVAFERQLASQVSRLTNQRFAKESKALTSQQKQELIGILEFEIEDRLKTELENVQLLQIPPLLMPFEVEDLEDDVFTEKKAGFKTKKQSAPPPSPQSPQADPESGYDTSDHDSSETEA